MDLSKTILTVFLLAILGFAADGKVSYYYSVNLGCEGNRLELGGGIVFVSGKRPLKVDSLVQYIWAGNDGIPNEPHSYKKTAGDDVLIKEGRIGDDQAWKCFAGVPGLFFESISGKIESVQPVKIYVRAWENEKKYGDSDIVTLAGSSTIMPLPVDVGLKSFYVNKAIK